MTEARITALEILIKDLSAKLDAVLADIPGKNSRKIHSTDLAENSIDVHAERIDDLETRVGRIEVLLFRTPLKDFGVLDANIAALLPSAAENDRHGATHAERQCERFEAKVPEHDRFHPEEHIVPGLPGVSFIPALDADAHLHANALLNSFGSDLKDLSVHEFHSTVIQRTEVSIQKMLESNTAIRELDGELQDEFLRETVEENDQLIATYRAGLVQLQRQIREGLVGVVAADGQKGYRSTDVAENGLSL